MSKSLSLSCSLTLNVNALAVLTLVAVGLAVGDVISVEAYDPAGNHVGSFHTSYAGKDTLLIDFKPSENTMFAKVKAADGNWVLRHSPIAPGSYRFATRVYNADWSEQQFANESAASISIV